jgi:phenylpropionate dioxygenase-like ring-hydroxylating dioxygenase large terminal subunit
MFIHDTHLPQVLTPEEYTSEDHLDKEMGALFHDGWQLVGALPDIPNDGDYITFQLFDKPLIVWNRDGGIHAFLNVCPHRFSMLTHNACGQAKERLRCQYHGWEYDETGNTRKIPDARSFKPMPHGELGLTKFHAETVGQLIYVNLSENPLTLREQLGPGYEVAEKLFADDLRMILSMDYEVECNWKIKIENSLESYHVDFVHPNTFKETPEAEICFHELQPGWTTYKTRQRAVSEIEHRMNLLVHRLARADFDGEYKHYHYYPSMMFGKMGLFTFAETVFPISPHRTRIFGKFFVYSGPRGRLGSYLLYRGLKRWGRKFWPKVVEEDTSVMPDIQKGMQSGQHPSRGLISIREERLFHFQEYIRDNTMDVSGKPVVMS